MARTLSEIYALARKHRDERLELTEMQNKSKMSVMDAFTWVTSACIWTFENILDVFKVDLAEDLSNRVNGTPSYLANALLQYQSGDELVISKDGTKFSYNQKDESKRIISKVAYSEVEEKGFHDKQIVLKIATGNKGDYKKIPYNELVSIRSYLNQILFAGQHAIVVSRKGDVLIPRVTVYYDGAVSEDEVYDNIEAALNTFIENIDFDGVVYVQKIIDAIQSAEHVVDVEAFSSDNDRQGIFVAQYDDDDNLIGDDENAEKRVDRYFIPNSGYITQSSKSGAEKNLQTWKEAITIKIEDRK